MLVEAQEKISKNEQTVNINSSSLKKQQKPCKKQECEKTMWGGRGRMRERCQGNALGSPGRWEGKGEKAGKQRRDGKGGEEESGGQQEGRGGEAERPERRKGGRELALKCPLFLSAWSNKNTPFSLCKMYPNTGAIYLIYLNNTREEHASRRQREKTVIKETDKVHSKTFQSCLLLSGSACMTGAPRSVAHQAPLSTESSRQECWSRFPFPSPKELLIMLIYNQKKKKTFISKKI